MSRPLSTINWPFITSTYNYNFLYWGIHPAKSSTYLLTVKKCDRHICWPLKKMWPTCSLSHVANSYSSNDYNGGGSCYNEDCMSWWALRSEHLSCRRSCHSRDTYQVHILSIQLFDFLFSCDGERVNVFVPLYRDQQDFIVNNLMMTGGDGLQNIHGDNINIQHYNDTKVLL